MRKIFSNIIKEILADYKAEGKKVNQQDLANVLGMTKQSFSNKMARDTFTLEDVIKIADFFNMKVILQGESEYIINRKD